MEEIPLVTTADVRKVWIRHFQNLFDEENGGMQVVVTANYLAAERVMEDFLEEGVPVEKIEWDRLFSNETSPYV